MIGHTPSRRELLDALIREAREDYPEDRALKRTLAVLGFANTLGVASVASGAAARVVAGSGVGAGDAGAAVLGASGASSSGAALTAGSGALGKAAGVGAAVAAPGVLATTVAPSGVAFVPIALAKWFAVGIVAGAGTLGAGAVVQSRLEVPRQTALTRPESDASLRIPERGQPGNAHERHPTVPSGEAAPSASPRPTNERATNERATNERADGRPAATRSTSAESATFATPGLQQRVQASESDATPDPNQTASPLREEVDCIERSRSALRIGAAAETIEYAEQYLRRFPAGVFVAEGYYLIMEARRRSGDSEGAKRSARVLVSRFPNSAASVKARQVLEIR